MSALAWRHIDMFVVINLDHRVDRWKEISAQYETAPGFRTTKSTGFRRSRRAALSGLQREPSGHNPLAKSQGWKNVCVNEDDFNVIGDRKLVWQQVNRFFTKRPLPEQLTWPCSPRTTPSTLYRCDDEVFYSRRPPTPPVTLSVAPFTGKLIERWTESLKQLKATGDVHNYITNARLGWQPLPRPETGSPSSPSSATSDPPSPTSTPASSATTTPSSRNKSLSV